jgi:hypothetical protein
MPTNAGSSCASPSTMCYPFSAATCHASLHTRRWTDRPRHCPRGHRHAVSPWGLDPHRPGGTRSWGPGGERTCHDRTNTWLPQRKRSLPPWMLAPCLLGLAWSAQRRARALGRRVHPRSRWCWWRRNAALSSERPRPLAGTGEADDLSHTAGHTGQATGGESSREDAGRGTGASSGSLGGATRTQTGPPSARGSGATGRSSSRRRAISRCSRDSRPPPSRCTRAVGALPTQPAALGRCKATSRTPAIPRSRNTPGVTCTKIAPRACCPSASPLCGCCGV